VHASLKFPRVTIVDRIGVEPQDLHVQHRDSLRERPAQLSLCELVHH
jgi:hypothetical protein